MLVFQTIFRQTAVGSIVLCCAFAGCSGELEPEGMPKRHPTVIQFTQAGQPCDGASVRLHPETPNNWAVGGSTDASGTVELKTYGKYPGVPEGKYKIIISKNERETVGAAPASMYEVQQDEVYDLIDPVYSTPSGTPLSIEVKPGKNSFGPFDLGEKVRQKTVKPPGTPGM